MCADWNSITKEGASAGDHWAAYTAAKKFADQAALEFADAHPEIDVTICMCSNLEYDFSNPLISLSQYLHVGSSGPSSQDSSISFQHPILKHSPQTATSMPFFALKTPTTHRPAESLTSAMSPEHTSSLWTPHHRPSSDVNVTPSYRRTRRRTAMLSSSLRTSVQSSENASRIRERHRVLRYRKGWRGRAWRMSLGLRRVIIGRGRRLSWIRWIASLLWRRNGKRMVMKSFSQKGSRFRRACVEVHRIAGTDRGM